MDAKARQSIGRNLTLDDLGWSGGDILLPRQVPQILTLSAVMVDVISRS
jgi:hypothetical protein